MGFCGMGFEEPGLLVPPGLRLTDKLLQIESHYWHIYFTNVKQIELVEKNTELNIKDLLATILET
jgi:hypothetical protein